MAVDRTERGLNGMDIVKVSIMGICGMMLGFILKETRPEFAALVTMMTGFLILGLAAGKVSYLFETMNRLRESFPIDSSYLTVLVKIIGITYIGQFSSAICKDAGYQMIGNFHSHPESPSRPSEEDKRLAFDPNIEYLILSLMDAENPVLKAFGVDKEKNVTVHELQITE